MAYDFYGKMIIFTAPSGAGKTTIVHHILAKFDEVAFSVSATTRRKRDSEKEGIDYYFLSTEAFIDKINQGAFLEWEEVYDGVFYGTLKSEVDRQWKKRKHIIFDIDVYGAMRLKNLYPERVVTIFVKAPSLEIIIERLKIRKTDSRNSLRKRISRIKNEMTYESLCDKVIFNDTLADAFEQAEIIVGEVLNKRED